jgi:hypothetical protein
LLTIGDSSDLPTVPIRDIGWARQHLTNGQSVRRRIWLTLFRLELKEGVIWECAVANGRSVRKWVPTQEDILATDYELAE